VVFFDDSASTTRQDFVLWQGNDSNQAYGFDVQGTVVALAVLPDGKILPGGSIYHVTPEQRNGIARLNRDGSLDHGFDPGLGAQIDTAYGTVNGVAVETDGKVI